MKVSDMSGETLDYWVARANGWTRKAGAWVDSQGVEQYAPAACYDPSHAWELAGPIIERERIGMFEGAEWPEPGTPPAQWIWYACVEGSPDYGPNLESYDHPTVSGPSPLVAAMRAFVASKFGDTVPDEQ
jgi:hypothetical protein